MGWSVGGSGGDGVFTISRTAALRWTAVAGALVLLFGLFRLFLLVCPTRDWTVLRWSFEARTAANWNSPVVPALVAENALENGGAIGEWVGRRLYARTLGSARLSPFPDSRTPYAQAHINTVWLGTHSISWTSKPWRGDVVQVSVTVYATLPQSVEVTAQCSVREPQDSLVQRNYLTVPTARGWRVVSVSTVYAGSALAVGGRPSKTPMTVLGDC